MTKEEALKELRDPFILLKFSNQITSLSWRNWVLRREEFERYIKSPSVPHSEYDWACPLTSSSASSPEMVVWQKSACLISPDPPLGNCASHSCLQPLNLSKVVEMPLKTRRIHVSLELGQMLSKTSLCWIGQERKPGCFINSRQRKVWRGEKCGGSYRYNRLFVVRHRLFHPYFF